MFLFVLAIVSLFDAEPELRTASTHPMKYYLSLPSGWTKDKSWPVAVLIPDAQRQFAVNLAAFEKARGKMPFILVAPHVVTSGGSNYRLANSYRYTETDWKNIRQAGDYQFDETGIAAIAADVKRLYHGEEKFFLTGWEAGGHTVWAMTFRHPDWLRGVVPVSTNYLGRWLDEAAFSQSTARRDLPIRILFCDKSAAPQGWEHLLRQTKQAMDTAQSHGFSQPTLKQIPSRPHGPLAEEVLECINSILEGKR